MINHIQFPNLGLAFTVNRVAFSIAGFDVYWYGIILTTGIVISAALGLKIGSKYFKINEDDFIDVILICAVFGIISARAYYVAFAPFKYESFWDMINIRDGGIAIYGSVIGAYVSGYFACKWKKINFWDAFDTAAVCFPLGQAIGRWGNFVNQEAFGTNTTSIFGMYSEGTYSYLASVKDYLAQQGVTVDPTMPVHPTFLYESVWCLFIFILLYFMIKNRRFKGEILAQYAMMYGIERFFVEGLRTDSLEVFAGLRTSQIVAFICVLCGSAFLVYNYNKLKKNPPKKKGKA